MARTRRWVVVESKHWRRDDGKTASIYGAMPWTSAEEQPRWSIVTGGWTVRDKRNGTIGIGREPWATRAEAMAWIASYEARMAEVAAKVEGK